MLLRYSLYTLIWGGVILLLTLTTGGSNANLKFEYVDKLIHITMFGILSLFMVIGFRKQYDYKNINVKAELYAITFTILYSVLIEGIQYFIPHRGFEYLDILANSIGSGVGVGVYYLIYKL